MLSLPEDSPHSAFTSYHTQGNAYDLSKMGLVRKKPENTEKDKYIDHYLLPMGYSPSSSPRDLSQVKTAPVHLKFNHRQQLLLGLE